MEHGWFDWLSLSLGIAGFLFSVLGIWLTVRADKKAKDYENKLKELAEKADNINNTVQTRAIGRFPENLRAVIELIKRTKKTLYIATDVAAYGQLSNSEECAKYLVDLLELTAQKIDVQLLAYSGTRADMERRRQFADHLSKDKGFEKLIAEPRWREFASRHKISTVRNFDDIFNALIYTDMIFRRSAVEGSVQLFEIEAQQHSLPVFFWLRDGEEAIFSLFTTGEKSREISFRTVDQAITDVLASTFASQRDKAAKPFDPHMDLTAYHYLRKQAAPKTVDLAAATS